MSSTATTTSSKTRPAASPKCLVRSVAGAMRAEPSLEAVTITSGGQPRSIALMGKRADPELEQRVTVAVEQGRKASEHHQCALLGKEGDCHTCDIPLAADERTTFTITREADGHTVARVTCPTAPRFWHWHDLALPKIVPREVEIPEPEDEAHINEWRHQLAAALICGASALTAHFASGVAQLVLFVLSYAAGARFAAEEVLERLQHRTLDVHFLMLAVAFGSASIGAWAEGATLLFLFSFSGALEHYAMGRTQHEIRALFKSAPKTATVLDGGHEREAPVAELRPGARLLVKPGAQFPVDAEIISGRTAADESNLTGEAAPVEKNVGDTVLAGTLNQWGAVEAVVLRPASESALERIIRLIREAQKMRAPSQRFTDKFGTGYTYAILGISAAMFLVWWLGFGLPPFASAGAAHSAFYRTMTLLVVASPCALVLSIPSAVLAAIAHGARRGILFRGGAAVEELADVNVVALDKTGTLTTGELQVERVESFPPGREAEVASLAFSLERLSTHPLARAITRHGKQQALPVVNFDHFESVTGSGLKAVRAGKTCWLGKREWVCAQAGQNVCDAAKSHAVAAEPGHAEIWLAEDGLVGRILLRDDLRPQAASVLTELRREGLHSVVLTGDRRDTAEMLKQRLRLEDVRAELKPEQKVAAIRELSQSGNRVAMIGDGVNDAPSLAAAHVGVAMGARGSDAALEQAAVVLMHDRLENFLAAFRLSRRAKAVIRQNLVISLGTVAVLVGFAMFGMIPLTLGVIGHEGSTVVVVLNSLRLLFSGSEQN
ncbi:MAG: heavy metal translocating P-type ATPase [Verrucomicrobia bacterium]|nr:heavy metal translocating P-type ATPase [Verrucomicrobiota bacterium]